MVVGVEARDRWVGWAMRLHTIADAGLEFSKDPYDLERYEMLRALMLEMVDHHVSDAGPTTLAELFPVGHGYPTPKIDVRALVVDDHERVLCVQNAGRGGWSLPGGFADLAESPMQCAARELQEETGYTAEPLRLLTLMDADRHRSTPMRWSFWQVVIGCRITGGAPRPSLETLDVGWFSPDSLPPLDQRSPAEVVNLALQAHHSGEVHCD